MLNAEFFRTSDNSPLQINEEEGEFVWHQYTRDSWYVRISDPNVTGVFIKVGDEDVFLEKYMTDGCYSVSKDVGKRIAHLIERQAGQKQNPGSWVGLLDLWWSSSNKPSQRLNPPIYIEPSHLNANEFNRIIKRLQILAFFRYSPTRIKYEESGGSENGGTETYKDELLKQAAEKFLALVKQVYLDWSLVRAAASRETRLLPKMVDVSSAGHLSSQIAAKVTQHPHARRLQVLMPQESFVTVENQFVVYVLREISQKMPLFNEQLNLRSNEIQTEWTTSENAEDKLRQRKPEWQQKQHEQQAMSNLMEKLAQEIIQVSEEVTSFIDDPFLKEVRNSPMLPKRPTDQLVRSLAYGSIFNKFCEYHDQHGISFVPLKPGLMREEDSKAIHPACTLYELWVFAEIYDMLIRTFGFQPSAGNVGKHPLDYIDSEAGEIVGNALRGKEFRLEFRPTNHSQRLITVSLFYDTLRSTKMGKNLRPDLFIEITEDDSKGKGKMMSFAIDAKYHSYPGFYMRPEREKHGVATVFELDLLITAKAKYYDKLGCDAAFVVHSEDNAKYTYWGGRAYGTQDLPPEHHYGAVFANPSDTSNLRKLLKCLLMYHMRIEDVCWSCRVSVEKRNVLSKSNWVPTKQHDEAGRVIGIHQVDIGRQPVGNDYFCNDCQRSWMRTWCSNPNYPLQDRQLKHRIMKVGKDDFHDKNTKGIICPSCGDGE